MKRFSISMIVATVGFFSWAQPVKTAKPLMTPQEEEGLARNHAVTAAICFSAPPPPSRRRAGVGRG